MSELQILAPAVDDKARVNPEVPVDLFNSHAQAKFWIGRVATMGIADGNCEEYYDGLLEFRANVYIHELEFISIEDESGNPILNMNGTPVLDEFGRETDDDDERSINFASIEHINIDTAEEGARVVGSGRLIVKQGASRELPIEHYFPELFIDNPLPDHVVEISRFIARHSDTEAFTQHKIALGIIRAMVHYAVNNDIEDSYCMIEKPLVKLLNFIGLPLTVIGEPKDVPEYNGILYPVKIEPYKIIDSLEKDKSGTIHLKEFFANTDGHTGDAAYFDETLMKEV